jgi:hypothetical protein
MNKIRVWNHTSKNYLKPQELPSFFAEITVSGGNIIYPNKFKVEQSTLMFDKSGQEIYEGDVIRSNFGDCEVVLTPGVFRFGETGEMLANRFTHWNDAGDELTDVKIVGSLMQQPDLIKRKERKIS